MSGRPLWLVSVGPPEPDPGLMRWLARALGSRIGPATVVATPLRARAEWWDADRSQLRSTPVVDALIELNPPESERSLPEWVLGVTGADLFVPERDFVFGEATWEGAWALVSTARLAADPSRVRDRLLKEALHELGHLAGLPHCPNTACVMAPSRTVADVDRKGADLCAECEARGRLRRGP